MILIFFFLLRNMYTKTDLEVVYAIVHVHTTFLIDIDKINKSSLVVCWQVTSPLSVTITNHFSLRHVIFS